MKKSKKKNPSKITKRAAEKIASDIYSEFDDLVSSISKDKNKLKAISYKSYNHLNGFSKIVLDDNKNYKVRLHIWKDTKGYKDSMGDIHDHRWSYVSLPLFGLLKEDRYKEKIVDVRTKKGDVKYKYKCYSRGESEWLNLEGYRKVRLSKANSYKRKAGKLYFCKAGEIHTIRPEKFPAASLVITFNPERTYARIYRNKIETEDFMKIYAPSLKSSEVKKAFSFVKNNRE